MGLPAEETNKAFLQHSTQVIAFNIAFNQIWTTNNYGSKIASDLNIAVVKLYAETILKIWSNWLILSTKIKCWPLSLWINLITVWGVASFHRSEGKVFLFFSPCLLSYAANCSSHYPSTVSPFSVIEILVATSYHAQDLPSLQSCLKTNIWIRHVFRSVIARYLRCVSCQHKLPW